MRFDGTLASWDDESGFGFIRPAKGGQEIFAHISAFPRDGVRPAAGQFVSFEVELNADGKKRAKAILRPRRPATADTPRPSPAGPESAPRSRFRIVPALLLIFGVVAFGYRDGKAPPSAPSAHEETITPVAAPPLPRFQCDERRYCSQMTSCEEAKYFLQHCPGAEMDGNRDGEPCERQCESGDWRRPGTGGR